MKSFSQKTFFFDTNIYNHLYDNFDISQQRIILHRLKERGIIICTVPQILGELSATYKADPVKGQQLCQLYASFVDDHGAMYQPPELLLIEVATSFGLTEIQELEEHAKNRAKDFGNAVAILTSGHCDKETYLFIETITAIKKEHHSHFKDSKKLKRDLSVKGKDISFDSIWNDELQSGRFKEGLVVYLQTLVRQKQLPPQLDIEHVSNLIVSNIDQLPHLKAAGKIAPAMAYRYFLKNEKVKFGDLVDSGNLVAVATLDGFVSDDEGALSVARLMFSDKKVICLKEFLELIEYGI